jgi:hypothetical protein
MGYNVHDVLRKVIVYYTRKYKKNYINFWLWFEIVIIFKDETLNLQGINTLSKIHILLKIYKQKIVMYLENISIYYKDLQKNCSKIYLCENFYFWAKERVVIF